MVIAGEHAINIAAAAAARPVEIRLRPMIELFFLDVQCADREYIGYFLPQIRRPTVQRNVRQMGSQSTYSGIEILI